jgi:hypothetical protein
MKANSLTASGFLRIGSQRWPLMGIGDEVGSDEQLIEFLVIFQVICENL